MKTATQQLIELAEFLSPTGVIGDGTVAHFHELAARARLEIAAYVESAENFAEYEGVDLGCPPLLCTRCAARDEARERYESECG